jgi:hypothetical protein
MPVSRSAPTTMRSAALSAAVVRSAFAGSPSTSRAAEMVADCSRATPTASAIAALASARPVTRPMRVSPPRVATLRASSRRLSSE